MFGNHMLTRERSSSLLNRRSPHAAAEQPRSSWAGSRFDRFMHRNSYSSEHSTGFAAQHTLMQRPPDQSRGTRSAPCRGRVSPRATPLPIQVSEDDEEDEARESGCCKLFACRTRRGKVGTATRPPQPQRV